MAEPGALGPVSNEVDGAVVVGVPPRLDRFALQGAGGVAALEVAACHRLGPGRLRHVEALVIDHATLATAADRGPLRFSFSYARA